MRRVTLAPRADPALDRARAAAVRAGTQALIDLLRDTGLIMPAGIDPEQWARGFAEVLARVACPAGVDAAWAEFCHTISAWNRPKQGTP